MNDEDKEVMSHIDADEFIMEDKEIYDSSFSTAQEILNNIKGLPKEHQEVVIQNSIKIHGNVAFLLGETDFKTEFWKQ